MPNHRLAYYAELSQVGIEMAAPIAVGALIDHWQGWGPWGAAVGAVLGFVGGIYHLVRLSNRKLPDEDGPESDKPKGPVA